MHSSDLARLAGVSTDTLRYYERLRLLPTAPRSSAGYRLFPALALDRVRLIRDAFAIGFSVRELTTIFAERDRGGAPCQRVLVLAREKLATVEASLRHLQIWRRELKTTLAGWERQLRKTPRGPFKSAVSCFSRQAYAPNACTTVKTNGDSSGTREQPRHRYWLNDHFEHGNV